MNPSSDPFNPQQPQPNLGASTPSAEAAQSNTPLTSFTPDVLTAEAPAQPTVAPATFSSPTPEIQPDIAASAAPSVAPETPLAQDPQTTPEATPNVFESTTFAPASSATSPAAPTPEIPVAPAAGPATPPFSFGQPATTGGPVVSAPLSPITPPPTPQKKNGKGKKLLLFIGLPLIVLAGAAAGYWFLYLPNTPDGVWNYGMKRTGIALERLTTSATEAKTLDSYKTSHITGNVTVTSGDTTYKGDISSTFNDTSSDTTANASLPEFGVNGGEAKLSLDVRSASSASLYPDIYFRVNGLSQIGAFDIPSNVLAYDNQWIAVSGDYLQTTLANAGIEAPDAEANKEEPTAADISALTREAMRVTNEYVFTTNADKAVFVKDSFVGKETVNDVATHHYKVKINQTNLGKYCSAVVEVFFASEVYKKAYSELADENTKQKALDSCTSETDDANDEAFDMWIESGRKVIHKIRITTKTEEQDYEAYYKARDDAYSSNDYESTTGLEVPTKTRTTYTEFGWREPSDDKILFFAENTEEGSDEKTTLEITLDTKTYEVSFGGTHKGNTYNMELTIGIKPSDEDVTIERPTNATPIADVLEALGLGGSDYNYSDSVLGAQTETPSIQSNNWLRNLQSFTN